jgi:hypothetical protein
MGQYLIDLTASISLVLLVGWLVQYSASDAYLRDATTAGNDVYAAISRFTPRNLFASYTATIDPMTRSLAPGFNASDGFRSASGQAASAVGLLVLDLAIAVPRTMMRLYDETSGLAAWVVLAGFGMAIFGVFAWLLAAKTSLWRLLLATALSPIAISVVFTILQAFMALLLDAFHWATALAPYAVACPVLCTLYWIVCPDADRGATARLAGAIGRALGIRD